MDGDQTEFFPSKFCFVVRDISTEWFKPFQPHFVSDTNFLMIYSIEHNMCCWIAFEI